MKQFQLEFKIPTEIRIYTNWGYTDHVAIVPIKIIPRPSRRPIPSVEIALTGVDVGYLTQTEALLFEDTADCVMLATTNKDADVYFIRAHRRDDGISLGITTHFSVLGQPVFKDVPVTNKEGVQVGMYSLRQRQILFGEHYKPELYEQLFISKKSFEMKIVDAREAQADCIPAAAYMLAMVPLSDIEKE